MPLLENIHINLRLNILCQKKFPMQKAIMLRLEMYLFKNRDDTLYI